MARATMYKTDQLVHHTGSSPVVVHREQPDALTTVERRIYLEKNENLSATHRTVVEIRTSLDTFEKGRTVEETNSEQGRTPVLQYRVVPKIKEVEVPEVQVEYDDTYVEVPVPFELPIIAPRQVPVEQVVQRNIPKPINVQTKQHFRMPRIQPKYYDVKVPIYVPSYVEVPVPSHFVAMKRGESFPEKVQLGPAVPHLPSCPVVPDINGGERYAADLKIKETATVAVSEQEEVQAAAEKVLSVSTSGLPTLHRRGSGGSELGYSSCALVQGAYPAVEFVSVSTRGSLNEFMLPNGKDNDMRLEKNDRVGEKSAHEDVLLDEEEQMRMEGEASGEETASDYIAGKMNEFNSSEAGGATPALTASPALVHAAA